MAESLQQLRKAIIAGERVTIDDSSIFINDSVRLDRSAGTKLRHFAGRKKEEYTLEEVYFQYIFRQLPYTRYLSECAKKRVNHVVALDRNPLVDYLTGAIDTLPNIVPDEQANNETSTASWKAIKAESKDEHNLLVPTENELDDRKKRISGPSFSANRLRVRDQRSIDSVLMVKDWDFSNLREKLTQHVTSARRSRPNNTTTTGSHSNQASENHHSRHQRQQLNAAAKAFDPRGDRYTSNEDRFWRENMGSDFQEFGIDMSGSFKAKPSSSQNRPQDRNPKNSRPSHSSVHQHPQHTNSKEGPPPAKRQKLFKNTVTPIIIIPAGTSSLVCAANAVEFFQNGHLMTTDEMRAKKISLSQPSRLSLLRKPGGNCSQARYDIVSNPTRLSREEWEHVVAVVLSGHSWQFKHWPIYKGDTQTLFKTVQGFYFHYDDVTPSGDLNQWSIRRLTFPRDRRHNDGQVQSQFWNFVDSFISRNQIPVRY